MTIALFVGSPRVRSNSRSMAGFLRARLEERGEHVALLDPHGARLDRDRFVADSIDVLREADALVILAPVYIDLPPHVALAWLAELWARREELADAAPAIYAISHSGYFDRIHKRASLEALEHFSGRMGWPWRGGLAFGGTSPIDGKPLEEAGPFSAKVRPALEQLAGVIHEDLPIPEDLIRAAGRRPIPLPNRLTVWLMNTALRRR